MTFFPQACDSSSSPHPLPWESEGVVLVVSLRSSFGPRPHHHHRLWLSRQFVLDWRRQPLALGQLRVAIHLHPPKSQSLSWGACTLVDMCSASLLWSEPRMVVRASTQVHVACCMWNRHVLVSSLIIFSWFNKNRKKGWKIVSIISEKLLWHVSSYYYMCPPTRHLPKKNCGALVCLLCYTLCVCACVVFVSVCVNVCARARARTRVHPLRNEGENRALKAKTNTCPANKICRQYLYFCTSKPSKLCTTEAQLIRPPPLLTVLKL
jgi:hypothetical protein